MSNKLRKKGRPTIRDVARVAQVAPITVSRVVNNSGYIGVETRRRVEKAIAELNYIPNALSQSLRYQKTDMITLLVSDVTNPFWTTITRGVEDVCSANGLHVILCNTDENSTKLENYVRILLQHQMDGFILAANRDDAHIVRLIGDNHIPIVLVDRVLEDVNSPAVYSDSETGAYELTQHLIELGHTRIALLASSLQQSTSTQRADGYRRALVAYGLPVDEALILHGSYSQQSGYQMMMQLNEELDQLPTALLTANNFIALGVQRALSELHLAIPKDISLATFDDLPFQLYPEPFLTTAAQNPYRLGQEAARLLVEQIEGRGAGDRQSIVLPVDIIIRQSTAPPACSE
jgi:LacI family transcriptional regulator